MSQPARPHDTPFKQQKLASWQPILTPFSVILTFVIIAVIFIPIGAGILASSNSVIAVGPIRYDHDEDLINSTKVYVEWPEDTSDNVYVYYQLSNFYQNHRRYVKSRSDVQLAGSSKDAKETLGDCSPWETFADHTPNTYDDISGVNETKLSTYKLNPCGLIAGSQFNDTLVLKSGICKTDSACDKASDVTWTKNGIAWDSDKEKKFHNIDGYSGPSLSQQIDVEDEDFIVWMRTAGLPTFKKLYRIIKGGLKKGDYTMVIDQNFPVKSFDGKKAIYLSTVTWIGGKNDFLGWAYVVVGIICLVLALAFFIKDRLHPRSVGDPRR